MVGWHHQLDGHESEQAPEVGDGQWSLACGSPCGRKELGTTEQLNLTELRCLSKTRGTPRKVAIDSLLAEQLEKADQGGDF